MFTKRLHGHPVKTYVTNVPIHISEHAWDTGWDEVHPNVTRECGWAVGSQLTSLFIVYALLSNSECYFFNREIF